MDNKKICFITCVSNEIYYKEILLYLRHIECPKDMSIEYIAVRGAASLSAGYNDAMMTSNAKYKVYLHQDCFLLHKESLRKIIKVFQDNPSIGLIGLAGCTKMPETGVWWQSDSKIGRIYHSEVPEHIFETRYEDFVDDFMNVQVIDGVFMATQYDLPWRQDLFDGWHFYDVSQSLEFYRHGYGVAVIHQNSAWTVHVTGDKDLGEDYEEDRKKFLAEYKRELTI